MIFGIGTDVAEVPRFEKWVRDPDLLGRFFAAGEQFAGDAARTPNRACEHYAARFAAKEAFAKALGTGFAGLDLRDFWIVHGAGGKPEFAFGEKTRAVLAARAGAGAVVHVSLSHEKSVAVAFVVIERAARIAGTEFTD